MTYFAELDENDNVIRVLVVEQDIINSGVFGDPSKWVETSKDTKQGINRTGGTPLRKNYAKKGMKYDRIRDMFIDEQPYPSWTLNEDKGIWESPIDMPINPKNKNIKWNENIKNWEFD